MEEGQTTRIEALLMLNAYLLLSGGQPSTDSNAVWESVGINLGIITKWLPDHRHPSGFENPGEIVWPEPPG